MKNAWILSLFAIGVVCFLGSRWCSSDSLKTPLILIGGVIVFIAWIYLQIIRLHRISQGPTLQKIAVAVIIIATVGCGAFLFLKFFYTGWARKTYSDGSVYEGNFKNGVPSGHGKLVMNNGTSAEGEYKDGKLNGNAVLKYPDGSIFEGVCRNGFEYCKGVLEDKTSTRVDVEIKNGRFVMPLSP